MRSSWFCKYNLNRRAITSINKFIHNVTRSKAEQLYVKDNVLGLQFGKIYEIFFSGTFFLNSGSFHMFEERDQSSRKLDCPIESGMFDHIDHILFKFSLFRYNIVDSLNHPCCHVSETYLNYVFWECLRF